MKFVVLTSNDTRDSLYENTLYGTRLYSDDNGNDPVELASAKIWERMQSDLEASNIYKVELNGETVFQKQDDEMGWGNVDKEPIDTLKLRTHAEIKAVYGCLMSASVVVRCSDDLFCGIFHKAQDRTPNDDTAEVV